MEHQIFITEMTYNSDDRLFKIEVEVQMNSHVEKIEVTAVDLADALYLVSNRIKSNIK